MVDQGAAARSIVNQVFEDIEEMSAISAPGPGVTRIAYTEEDAEARRWFRDRCRRYGLEFEVDPVGNCYGWTPAAEESRRPLLIGSHLDSVPTGGAYDGIVGVMIGLEAARYVVEHGFDLPIVAASFACEESTRFGVGTIGSKWLARELDLEAGPQLADQEGALLPKVLAASGIEELQPLRMRTTADFLGMIEVHIDQGTLLTSMGARIAVVSTIAGVDRIGLTWTGESSHSGARWREDRRDALVAASSFIVDVNSWWREVDPEGRRLQLTVGSLTVEPNSPNTVPGKVAAIVDTRSSDYEVLEQSTAEIVGLAERAAEEGGVEMTSRHIGRSNPLALDAIVSSSLSHSAERVGILAPAAPSLAGHDSLVIGRRIPTGMLLLANPTGISHAPNEGIDHQAVVDALSVILDVLPKLSQQLADQAS